MEDKWRWVALTAIAPVAWGATYYVTRAFLPADLPLQGGVVRALPAGLLLLVVGRTLPRGSWWWKSLVLGGLNMSGFFVLVYLAAQLLPTSIASVVMAMSPVAMMVVARALLSERPGTRRVVGAAMGITGVGVMLLTGRESVDLWGIAASVGAMIMSSLGYVLSKTWGREVPVLASTSWQLVAGGLLLLPVALVVEGMPTLPTASEAAGYAFVSVVATALAFMAWFTGLRHLSAGEVGLIGLLNPVAGVALGTVLGSEGLTARQVAGTVLVLAGILVGQGLRPRRSGREPTPPTATACDVSPRRAAGAPRCAPPRPVRCG